MRFFDAFACAGPYSRVACEDADLHRTGVIAGEITTKAMWTSMSLVRGTVAAIGLTMRCMGSIRIPAR